MKNLNIGDNALITCDNWFYAPDGNSYRCVFGKVKNVLTAEDTLGIRPNGRSTNWYVEIGNMTIAGCQIHYVVKTNKVSFGPTQQIQIHEGRTVVSDSPSAIYNANEDGLDVTEL